MPGDYLFFNCSAFCKAEKAENHCRYCKCGSCPFCERHAQPRSEAKSLTFIEIGTSNFNTLIQSGTPGPGLSVEALKFYLDELPDRREIRKVNAAVVARAVAEATPWISFFFVHPRDIKAYNLTAGLKGCNSAFEPHAYAKRYLKRRKLYHLLRNASVPTTSYSALVRGVKELGFLKLDMEGHEVPVLTEMADICSSGGLCPCRVKFEAVALEDNQGRGAATTTFRLPALLGMLQSAGYKCGAATKSNWLEAGSGCGSDCECVHTRKSASSKSCKLAAKVTEGTDLVSGGGRGKGRG